MRDVLPYRGYRIVDTQWLLCCGPASIPAVAVSGRVRGPDEEDYGFTATIMQEPGPRVPVRFFMREDRGRAAASVAAASPSAVDVAREIERERMLSDLRRERDEVEAQLTALRQSGVGPNHPQMLTLEQRRTLAERRVAEAATPSPVVRPSMPRALIDTSFTIAPSETVVIGTYQLRGDRALVVLLTAVPNVAR